MHIYAFGSVCRGDISRGSDIDLLAIVREYNSQIDPNIFSIYSYRRIEELWIEGNPFAWHLALESRIIFSANQCDYLRDMGNPESYKNCVRDCEKFLSLFLEAKASLESSSKSSVFDLSIVFLSIRNIATCFSLGMANQPVFSRNAALALGNDSIKIDLDSYQILERARILCTRGYGQAINNDEVQFTITRLNEIDNWMCSLVDKAKKNERI